VSLLFSWRHLLKNSICICSMWINLYLYHTNQSVFVACESICICTMWINLYLYHVNQFVFVPCESICICTMWINLFLYHVNQSVFVPCESICICTMWPNLYLYTQDKNELLLVQLHNVVYHLWKIHHNPFINEEELRTQDFRMFYAQTYERTDMCKSICPHT